MRKYRGYSIKYRWLAFVLCLALCIEGPSMHVLAAEENINAFIDISDEEQESDTQDVAGDADDIARNGNNGNSEDTDNTDSPDNIDHTEDTGDIGNTDDAGIGEGSEETDKANDTETGSDAEVADSDDHTTDTGDANDSDNDDSTLDTDDWENGDSADDEDSVSDNDADSISENNPGDERQALIQAAEEAFGKLLAEKDLMALLYHANNYGARKEADADSAVVATLQIGQTLYINGIKITEDDVWYRVQYWLDGVEGTGYVQSYYLAYSDEDWIAWEEQYLRPILESDSDYGRSAYGITTYSMITAAVDTSDIATFPGSYQSALRSLKNAHPNWIFVPMNTGLDFDSSVTKEMGVKSLIQKTTSNSEKGWVGEACPTESGWYYATRPAVAYYMDPRNFLTEIYIFQFEQLTFNASYHTTSAVQTFLDGTFMKSTLADDSAGRTYAQAFFEIGQNRKLSPIHLASRVYQEQGKGTSGLISGTYPGYEGYYNFFNVGVNGSSETEKIIKGLTYAKEKGWNTRYKSLEGGAATIGNNYILKYQDTIYLEKFNVDKNSPYGVYEHQYMQNIQAPASESSSTKKMYENAGSFNSAFVFKIPVYTDMPDDEYYPVLKMNKTTITMNRGEQQQLTVTADDIPLENTEVEWKSSSTSVATVENGLVTAVGAGEAVVTASFAGVEISCKVTVKIPLESISLDKTEIALRRPDTVVTDTTGLSTAEIAENIATASLQVSFDPADTTADRTIVWTSSNKKIATVTADPEDSSKAVVTAVDKGEVTITAKASQAGNQTATCKVRVSAPIYRVALTNLNAGDDSAQTTLLRGQGVNLAAEYWPKDTTSDTQVVWSTSNPQVATVKNGRVEAVGKGAAVITAKVAGCEKGYTAQHTIVVEECSVIFMNRDGETVWKELSVSYGSTLSQDTEGFPEEEPVENSVFIGWYTGVNGTGSRFDETTVIYQQYTTLYPYYEELGKGFYVLPVGDQTYTGSAVKPEIQVYDSVAGENSGIEPIKLELNKDYTVSYKNNKNVNLEGAAVPTITVKGKGNYSGNEYVYFNIVPKSLADTDITADDITAAYSGKTIKSAPAVYRNGKKLTKNTHYTVTYPQEGTGAYQIAGTYPIVITGKGGYSGTITIHETITNDVLMNKVSVAKIPNQTYSNDLVNKEVGIGIMPETLKVTYKQQTLIESTDGGLTGDYTVTYQNNTAIGTATAIITAVEGSGFAGSKSITYKIVGMSIAKAKVEGLIDKEYTGSEKDVLQEDRSYTLTLNDRVLIESKNGGATGDYVVSYTNTSKAGKATVIFQGVNEYTGQLKKTYKITSYDISPDESGRNEAITMEYYTQDEPDNLKPITTLSEITTPYVKGGSKPVVILYFNGIELTQGTDYTMKYANQNAVTTEEMPENKLPQITVTGKGSFKGSIKGSYTITDGQMAKVNKLTMTAKDVVYRNKKNAYKSSVALKDCNGSKLAVGKDYDKNLIYTYEYDTEWIGADGEPIRRNAGDIVEEDDIPEIGTVIRVKAYGTGFYAGGGAAAVSTTYRITAADISKAKVTVQAQVYQNGHEITLTENDLRITVSGNPEPLVYGVDYIIDASTYANNQNKGKASVVIRGWGNYGGEKKVTYTIGAKTLAWWRNLLNN